MTEIFKILPRLFVRRGDPLQLVFFITSRCNLQCAHCFYADELNRRKDELSLDEIEKVSRGMKPLLWLALTGGEPFLRTDIARIAEIFYRNNNYNILTITTNGVLKDQILEAVPEICATAAKSRLIVYVSIDGMEETHDLIRRMPGSFNKALQTIGEIKALKKTFKNLFVATITTCNAENQSQMRALAEFLKNEVKPDTIAINLLRGKACLGPLGKIDLKNYFDFIEVQREGWREGSFGYINVIARRMLQRKELLQKSIIAAAFCENKYVTPCLAGKISAVLSETGDLYPCEMLDKKIGNIRDAGYDFKKLWNSAQAEIIRHYIRKSKCRCTYECAISSNILFNVRQLAKIALFYRI